MQSSQSSSSKRAATGSGASSASASSAQPAAQPTGAGAPLRPPLQAPNSARKAKKQTTATGARTMAGAPMDDSSSSSGSGVSLDSSNGDELDDEQSVSARIMAAGAREAADAERAAAAAEEARQQLEEEVRAARTERAEQARTLRMLQEQIERLTMALGAGRANRQQNGARMDDSDARDDEEDRSSLSSHSSNSTSSSSIARRQGVLARKQLNIITPTPLAYDKANDSGALETWIDGMQLLFAQMDCNDDEERKLAEVQMFTDRDVRQWWEGQQQQARIEGAPIDTWARFCQILRAQFLPQLEVHKATSELINIRQQSGESMDQYFLRATRLYARTNGSFSDNAAMLIVLDRARKDEWPHALAVATREVQSGRVATLAQLRACLQREALAEPRRSQHSSSGGGQQKAQSVQKRRIAAIENGDSDEEDGSSSSVRAAPVQQRAPARNRCLRCKKSGHQVADCKQPDMRTCFICGQKGHMCRECPQRAKKVAVAAAESSAQAKNE